MIEGATSADLASAVCRRKSAVLSAVFCRQSITRLIAD